MSDEPREWIIEMRLPWNFKDNTGLITASLRRPPGDMEQYRHTMEPQKFSWVLSRIQWDIPPMAKFQIRNVNTNETIPGELFAL